MKTESKKYHQYSLSFYQREKELQEVNTRVKMGSSQLDKNDKALKRASIETFLAFNEHHKNGQRALLLEDTEAVMDALVDIVMNVNRDRDFMEYILPLLDAVLTEERRALRTVIESIRGGRYQGLITKLKGFWALEDHKDVTVLAAARVASAILGELPKEQFHQEQTNLMLELLQVKRYTLIEVEPRSRRYRTTGW